MDIRGMKVCRRFPKLAPFAAGLLVACSAGMEMEKNEASGEPGPTPAETPANPAATEMAEETALNRLEVIQRAVSAWANAPDLSMAKRHAEAARNLIVGPHGPGYGDADSDGRIAGANDVGLLPGLGGGAALAIPAANACAARDLLGGSWDDPEGRWTILQEKIESWRPDNNTFPTLPSHAQRVVGWATLALGSNDLAIARDYAGHAQIHVDVSRRALTNC